MAQPLIKPYKNDPFVGHLSTPISDSALVNNWISSLPIYRPGLAPLRRGLEIGMAHGYLLFGPWAKLGPLRNTSVGNMAAAGSAVGLIIILSACLTIYGKVTFKASSKDELLSPAGWQKFTQGFYVGGAGGAVFAFTLMSLLAMFGS
jgi:photosystem I subunit XI